MTIQAGICGFSTRVVATQSEDELVRVEIESECEHVRRLAGELSVVDPMTLFTLKAKDSEVFAAGARCLAHQTCPVPVGILKAVEVAAGFALPQGVSLAIEKEE